MIQYWIYNLESKYANILTDKKLSSHTLFDIKENDRIFIYLKQKTNSGFYAVCTATTNMKLNNNKFKIFKNKLMHKYYFNIDSIHIFNENLLIESFINIIQEEIVGFKNKKSFQIKFLKKNLEFIKFPENKGRRLYNFFTNYNNDIDDLFSNNTIDSDTQESKLNLISKSKSKFKSKSKPKTKSKSKSKSKQNESDEEFDQEAIESDQDIDEEYKQYIDEQYIDEQDSDEQDHDEQDSDEQDSDEQDSDEQDSDEQDQDEQDQDEQDQDEQDHDKQDSDEQDSEEEHNNEGNKIYKNIPVLITSEDQFPQNKKELITKIKLMENCKLYNNNSNDVELFKNKEKEKIKCKFIEIDENNINDDYEDFEEILEAYYSLKPIIKDYLTIYHVTNHYIYSNSLFIVNKI